MKTVMTDVLVIGGGLAGLRMAIAARKRGHEAIVLSLVPPKRSHSSAAQGGMQASLGNVAKGEGDNEDLHFDDTVRGSDWGADQIVARMFVNTAPKAARELAAWGTPWSRVRSGDHQVIINEQKVTLTERTEAHGLIAQRDFGGTKKWRTCYAADGTGHAMLYTTSNQAIGNGVDVHERTEALALIHDGERCYGAVVRNLITGELVAYLAKATAIAAGGAGRLYSATTSAVICEGMGHGLALETGVAPLGNMEAVQFHPTGIVPAGILVTEGCRGDGGLLRDVDGYRFMPDYEPEKKELASRDVVSRRMEEHIRSGKGVQSRFGPHLWLDITLLGRHHIEHNLREVKEICEYFLGIDPAEKWIPVRPTQHYTMGGVRTDHTGQSPWLKGLFAAGEAACWDLHGFNRLGGNSVSETVVAGMIVGEFIADFCDKPENCAPFPLTLAQEFVRREEAKLAAMLDGSGKEKAFQLYTEMQDVMTEHVGIFRQGDKLHAGVEQLQRLLARSAAIGVFSKSRASNPELVMGYRVRRMLKVALATAQGAYLRTESRGAHAREDFP
ncbi:MAG: fumarate reductase flavoprotein subunit, partial [Betaproteobacteria bacterium]|nr:fumarate reductase flavoprotein subunit [Betaproteobacteria bacterium]